MDKIDLTKLDAGTLLKLNRKFKYLKKAIKNETDIMECKDALYDVLKSFGVSNFDFLDKLAKELPVLVTLESDAFYDKMCDLLETNGFTSNQVEILIAVMQGSDADPEKLLAMS